MVQLSFCMLTKDDKILNDWFRLYSFGKQLLLHFVFSFKSKYTHDALAKKDVSAVLGDFIEIDI